MGKVRPAGETLLNEINFLEEVKVFLEKVHFVFSKEQEFNIFTNRAYEEFILCQNYTATGLFICLKKVLKEVTGYDADDKGVKA